MPGVQPLTLLVGARVGEAGDVHLAFASQHIFQTTRRSTRSSTSARLAPMRGVALVQSEAKAVTRRGSPFNERRCGQGQTSTDCGASARAAVTPAHGQWLDAPELGQQQHTAEEIRRLPPSPRWRGGDERRGGCGGGGGGGLSQTGGLSTAFSIVDYATDHVLPLHSYEGALHDVIVSIKAYHVNERLVSGGWWRRHHHQWCCRERCGLHCRGHDDGRSARLAPAQERLGDGMARCQTAGRSRCRPGR